MTADNTLLNTIRRILETAKSFVNYEEKDFEKAVIAVAGLQHKYIQMHITPSRTRSFTTPYFAVILIDEGFLQETWLRSNLDDALMTAWEVHEKNFNVHNAEGYVAVEISFMDAAQPAERIVQWDLDDREIGGLLPVNASEERPAPVPIDITSEESVDQVVGRRSLFTYYFPGQSIIVERGEIITRDIWEELCGAGYEIIGIQGEAK